MPASMARPRPNPGTDVEKFGTWIGVGPLLDQVEATAPYLFRREPPEPDPTGQRLLELITGPWGWWHVLRAARRLLPSVRQPTADQLDDYVVLCCAAHHATVGTYCPTDVDAKIRGHLWMDADVSRLRAGWSLAQAWQGWDESLVSTRGERCGRHGLISGHDGERFGTWAGMLGAALVTPGAGDLALAARQAIDAELDREANAMREAITEVTANRGDEVALVRLAWITTHNVGDLDQGLSYWPKSSDHDAASGPLRRLAHDNAAVRSGVFLAAKRLYSLVLAEGHRNYPLRQARCLRLHPELLLPLGPCLEAWATRVATHPRLDRKDHQDVLHGLVEGCRKVPGQTGYYRALVGFREALGGSADRLMDGLSASDRRFLAEPASKRALMVSSASFRASLAKQVRSVLALGDALFQVRAEDRKEV